jgi:prepilin-type N-terminal cleavage/methylation domain-containing protein/prepilin-type processing-associated H-X9-DG protein
LAYGEVYTVEDQRVMRRSGFTLVEILVVTAILAVLAGILFPVLAQARAQARTAACASNLRQLGMAFAMYAQDADERLPDFHVDSLCAARAAQVPYWHDRFCRGLSLMPGQLSYVGLLAPYLRSPWLTFCPADMDRMAGGRDVTSYEYKVWLARGRTLAEVPDPAGMALVWEQWAYHADNPHASEYERRAAMNLLFVDGHVGWRRLADATTARYGAGPDLHGLFCETCPGHPLYGRDFVP